MAKSVQSFGSRMFQRVDLIESPVFPNRNRDQPRGDKYDYDAKTYGFKIETHEPNLE